MSFQYPINHLRLSASTLNLYRSCARKFEMVKMLRHPKKEEDNLPGSIGTAMHAAYQKWFQTKDYNTAVFELMLKYPYNLELYKEERYRTLEACYATLEEMMAQEHLLGYEIATIKVDGEIKPAIEVPFQINLNYELQPGIPIYYVGFIDLILFDKVSGKYFVLDIKTHRRNLKDLTPVYQFDDQCIPYALVLERILNEDIFDLHVKYLSAYIDIENPRVGVYSFEKNSTDIQDWGRQLMFEISQIKKFYELQWFPRNSNTCVNFNRVCPFFDNCEVRDPAKLQRLILMEQEPNEDREIIPWITVDLELTA